MICVKDVAKLLVSKHERPKWQHCSIMPSQHYGYIWALLVNMLTYGWYLVTNKSKMDPCSDSGRVEQL